MITKKNEGLFYRHLFLAFLLLLVFTQTGCNLSVVQAPSPWFGDSSLKDADPILGRWASPEQKAEMFVKKNSDGMISLEWSRQNEKALFHISLHQIGDRFFLQANGVDERKGKGVSDLGHQPAYLIFALSGLPETLQLEFPDAELFSRHFKGRFLEGWPHGVYALTESPSPERFMEFINRNENAFSAKRQMKFFRRRERVIAEKPEITSKGNRVMIEEDEGRIKKLTQFMSELFVQSLEADTVALIHRKFGFDEKLSSLLLLSESEPAEGRNHIASKLRIYSDVLLHLSEKFIERSQVAIKAADCLERSFDESIPGELQEILSVQKQAEAKIREKLNEIEALTRPLVLLPTMLDNYDFGPSGVKFVIFPSGEPVGIHWLDESGKDLAWAHLQTAYPDIRKALWSDAGESFQVLVNDVTQANLQVGNFNLAFFPENMEIDPDDGALPLLQQLFDLKALSLIELAPASSSRRPRSFSGFSW